MPKVKLYITDGYGNIPHDSQNAFTNAGVRLGAHKQGHTLVTGHTKADALTTLKAAKAGSVTHESQLRVVTTDRPVGAALESAGYLDNVGWVFATPLDSNGVARHEGVAEDIRKQQRECLIACILCRNFELM